MTLAHLCEIDFYIDGELEPDEVGEIEFCLQRDNRARALFDAAWRQKKTLGRALEALDYPRAANRRTARLVVELAQALSHRLAPAAACAESATPQRS